MSTAAAIDTDRHLIICPVLDALVHSGRLTLEEDGRVSFDVTREALLSIGLTRPLAGMLIGMAHLANGAHQILNNSRTRSFNPERMGHSILHHRADTGITGTGWFDPDRFDAMLAMSADGESLTLREIAAVVAVDQQRDPGVLGVFMSFVELGALLDVFGYSDRKGTQRIAITMLRSLYFDGELPEGWEPDGKVGILGTFGTVWKLLRELPSAPVVWVQGF